MKRLLFILIAALTLATTVDARRRMVPKSATTATKLEFSTQPSGAVTSTNFTTQPIVRATDSLGNLATGFNGPITVAKINGAGSLVGTATATASGGIATFSGLQWDTAGHYVLGASASGLTSTRSGMMTTVPSTTLYTQASLNFGGGTTSDKGNCGSASSLDNLPLSGQMTAIIRVKRNATGTNEFVISKVLTTGWSWQFANTIGGADGGIAAKVNRATSDAFDSTTTTFSVGTWYDIIFFWKTGSGTRDLRILYAPLGGTISEVAYDGGFDGTGSGTVSADADGEVWIGNLQVVPTVVAKSDIAWVAVFSNNLTPAQMDDVRTGFNRNNPAQINAAGTCVLLQRLNATGTLTDLSTVGTNSCVITGTTTGATNDFYVPVMPDNSTDPTNSTNYLFTDSFATYSYTTTATSATITAFRSLEATYANQASIGVLVDGVYSTQFAAPTLGDNNFGTVTLPAGSKTVTFVNGPRSRAVGASPPAEGTFLTSIQFNASATSVVPATPSSTLLYWGDSILADFVTNPVVQYGSTNLMRAYLYGSKSVMFEGFGGAQLYHYAADSTARAATVATLARYNPQMIFTELGANDYSGSIWSAPSYQAAWTAILADIHAELPNTIIYLSSMVTRPVETANSLGYTAADYRTAASAAATAANAAAGTTFVQFFNGPTQLWDGTNSGDGGSHPNNTGAAAVLANEKTDMGL